MLDILNGGQNKAVPRPTVVLRSKKVHKDVLVFYKRTTRGKGDLPASLLVLIAQAGRKLLIANCRPLK